MSMMLGTADIDLTTPLTALTTDVTSNVGIYLTLVGLLVAVGIFRHWIKFLGPRRAP